MQPEKAAKPSSSAGFGLEELNEFNEARDVQKLEAYGGAAGLAGLLGSSASDGLDPQATGHFSLDSRREQYGQNAFREQKSKSFLRMVFENLKDPTLILLMAAALVSTVIGSAIKSQREESGYSEGIAIWVAVFIVSFVGAGNDWQKEKQFKKLNAAKDSIEVKVVRAGEEKLISNHDVVVGDLLVLDTGDKIVADGVAVETYGLVVDEASLTGESEPLTKTPTEDPWCKSGTQVSEGSGRVLVTAVGVHSEWGKTMALVAGESHDTPLQEALSILAAAIGKVGLAVGVLCFVVLMIRWMVENKGFPASEIASGPLQYFIFAVTIVVVAVPEGLPLAVTISLAYSMKKMMKDNNFVRVLAACETMGGATAICSDKTGTLTENRMTVVAGWFADKQWTKPPTLADLPLNLADAIKMNIALNSKAFLVESDEKKGVEFVGNRTECALLMLLREWGLGYKVIRDSNHNATARIYGFTSERKMASMLLRTDSGLRLFNKGAAEIVVAKCDSYIDSSGIVSPLSEEKREEMLVEITRMAQQGLRTLCLSYRDFPTSADPASETFDFPPEENLTACCIVGIKDPVRPEVPGAVATCTRAGIFVRMVTGDNIHTAKHIARECGILTDDGIALEGPAFRRMPEAELIPMLPRLQVLARSSPTDKFTLVSLLRKQGEVVAVTGDGTNDAPALKEADVGLAMGIAGTEVAKEAADIVIMDDNFNSIVKSVLWGRSVFANLRKFLQFQLTINGVALVIAFVAAVTNGETPLNVLQLLWVNLIMDSLAALALATEAPNPELLHEKPHGRNESLISGAMWRQMVVQASYQLLVLFLVIYGAPQHIARYSLPSPCVAYSNTDGYNIPLSEVNVTGGSVEYNPPVPAPYADYSAQKARCWRGPCVDLCCNTNSGGTCTDNLASAGGHYLPNERPVCAFGGFNKRGAQLCTIRRVRRDMANFCPAGQSSCERAQQFNKLDNQAHTQYVADQDHVQEEFNSIVFNAFIWMQIFNQFNARKIRDEYNIFKGLWQSQMFIYVALIITGFQFIIMFTVVRNFFKVVVIPWEGWLYSILTGLGTLPVAFLVKFCARNCSCSCWPRRLRRGNRDTELPQSTPRSEDEKREWSSPRLWFRRSADPQPPQ